MVPYPRFEQVTLCTDSEKAPSPSLSSSSFLLVSTNSAYGRVRFFFDEGSDQLLTFPGSVQHWFLQYFDTGVLSQHWT